MTCVLKFILTSLLLTKEIMSTHHLTYSLHVVMVCVGNSCRSPMAESVLKSIIADNNPPINWYVDSAAIADWNVGFSPEPRCITVLGEHGLSSDHIARQITDEDFDRFDYIFAMDNMNLKYLQRLQPMESKAKVELLAKYDYGQSDIIDDPYFDDGVEGFRTAYKQIDRSCRNFVNHILQSDKNEL